MKIICLMLCRMIFCLPAAAQVSRVMRSATKIENLQQSVANDIKTNCPRRP